MAFVSNSLIFFQVSVRYIGKLKNGKIFDSNVSGRPFEFRLGGFLPDDVLCASVLMSSIHNDINDTLPTGAGEVIKGWDVGIDGINHHLALNHHLVRI